MQVISDPWGDDADIIHYGLPPRVPGATEPKLARVTTARIGVREGAGRVRV